MATAGKLTTHTHSHSRFTYATHTMTEDDTHAFIEEFKNS